MIKHFSRGFQRIIDIEKRSAFFAIFERGKTSRNVDSSRALHIEGRRIYCARVVGSTLTYVQGAKGRTEEFLCIMLAELAQAAPIY